MAVVESLPTKVDRIERKLDGHLTEHKRERKAVASRRQVRVNIVVAVLSPLATAALMKVLHLA